MRLSVILPVLFIAFVFFLLPVAGAESFFSIHVSSKWCAGSEARKTRRTYQALLVLVAGLSVAVAIFCEIHRHLTLMAPLLEVAGLVAAWSWGWNHTLPFRLQHPTTRTAVLRRQSAAQAARRWSLAALLPIFGTALVLLFRYQAIPASFPVHFGANAVPNHVALRSWISVFGPLTIGAVVVLLQAEMLRAIERRGAGVADGGRYKVLTGRLVVGIAWMVALECAASGLLPIVRHAGTYAMHLASFSGAAAIVLLLVTTGVLVVDRSLLVSAQSSTDEAYWKGGILYFNRDDAALFVPKRLGFGWTLNMAQPAAWLLMGLTLAVALLPLALKHL